MISSLTLRSSRCFYRHSSPRPGVSSCKPALPLTGVKASSSCVVTRSDSPAKMFILRRNLNNLLSTLCYSELCHCVAPPCPNRHGDLPNRVLSSQCLHFTTFEGFTVGGICALVENDVASTQRPRGLPTGIGVGSRRRKGHKSSGSVEFSVLSSSTAWPHQPSPKTRRY